MVRNSGELSALLGSKNDARVLHRERHLIVIKKYKCIIGGSIFMSGKFSLSMNNFVRELSGAIFIEDTRERPVLFESAEILGRSIVNKGRRKKPRPRIGQRNPRSSYDIKVVLISNNFALISRSEVRE